MQKQICNSQKLATRFIHGAVKLQNQVYKLYIMYIRTIFLGCRQVSFYFIWTGCSGPDFFKVRVSEGFGLRSLINVTCSYWKIEILVEIEIFVKNRNFGRKSKF